MSCARVTKYCTTLCHHWWQVMTGEGVSVGHVWTHLHQSQLVTWRVVAQSCAILCGSNFFQKRYIAELGAIASRMCVNMYFCLLINFQNKI